ncbi:GntR family transcriptional regulator [Acidocella aquatica]|uniref:GntR family transcriptional regulator n=1 Tax=Acidocella aquatica TaxID=1922313 RepID=A0ABQ6A492_9PROT|nr:GntR family transcriptional regulator [Acidocella aquatica]GLR66979.1 GntR family transcriptional regulator [Acidocella aquatica]
MKPGSNLAAVIRDTLEDEIEKGILPPGASLDERSLAERFNVSRTPVREALQQLAAIDLVKIAARNGVFVSRLTVSELRSMVELLAVLESVCAMFAARRLTDDLRTELLENMKKCEQAVAEHDYPAYRKANEAFHGAIYAASRNPYLAQIVHGIRVKTQRYRINDLKSERQVNESLAGHKRIVEAILAGADKAAYDAMLEHVPIGSTGFSEFLSTLPPGILEG